MGVETATTEGDGAEAGCRQLRLLSLAISPNLDKLLEYDEGLRTSNGTFPGTYNPMEAGSDTLSPGLPPPPRRNRQMSSKPVWSPPNTPSQSKSPNPYINPAPTAEELFLSSWHDSARPAPGSWQQSDDYNDPQHDLSSAWPYRFKAQTLGKFPGSSILSLSTDSLDHRTEDFGFTAHSTSATEFKATFGISTANTADTLSNISLDPSARGPAMSVIEMSSPGNQASPMATSPLASPTFRVVKPLPTSSTTPKAVFSRRPSLPMKRAAASSLPYHTTEIKPVTTNFLDGEERADLVRKSRKLARLFGETPDAEAVGNQAGLSANNIVHRKNYEPTPKYRRDRREVDGVMSFSRRYSLPVSVDGIPLIGFKAADGEGVETRTLCSDRASLSMENEIVQSMSRHKLEASSIRSPSPVSFMELSDDGSSTSVVSRTSVSSTDSLKAVSIDLLEEERRRKRERLAKLYRCLGSQVPVNLVLGINDDSVTSLPPPQKKRSSGSLAFDNIENRHSTLLQRRRRSSSAIPSASWSNDIERLKADLDDREKAIIVRRAQKMEKLFGVAPPLTLLNSAAGPSTRSVTPHTNNFPISPSTARKFSKQKENRNGKSTFYKHYQHSLNTLNDIMDRDDKESLAELHHTLRGDILAAIPDDQSESAAGESDGTTTPTSSSKSPGYERRGSLPTRTSMLSLDSEYSIAMPPPIPDAFSFQQRRKRAAKLTHFFGVDYKDLFDDVLDAIENDMQVGKRDGMLRAEEVEDLLQKLRNLRYKRQNL